MSSVRVQPEPEPISETVSTGAANAADDAVAVRGVLPAAASPGAASS
jgi:hypothetical protein